MKSEQRLNRFHGKLFKLDHLLAYTNYLLQSSSMRVKHDLGEIA